MSKTLTFFFIFILFQSTLAALSSCWFWELTSSDDDLTPHCNPVTEFKEIYMGKKCSNLFLIKEDDSWYYGRKTYLETVNNTYIKQWTLSKTSQSSVQFKIQNENVCKIFMAVKIDLKIDLVFANNFSFYYVSWNSYDNYPSPTAYHLTDDLLSILAITTKYVMVFNSANKTMTENVFSKSQKKFINFYTLKKFDQDIIDVEVYPSKNTTLIVKLEDGAKNYVDMEIPTEYTYVSNTNYGGSRYTYSINWFYVFIFVMIKLCVLWRICVICLPKDDETSAPTRLRNANDEILINVKTEN
uniref:Uncharacterized protein n=1 Tax=Panagrolaimus davidi TaxID=227884 RepID=A0A914QKT7_9BILA